jgi:hypothetical protein
MSVRPEPPKVGVVIGSFNLPSAVRLNVAAIRRHCGDATPILIADDCSDGCCATPPPESSFGRIVDLASRTPNVVVWPNADRIGHAGGDVSCFWKGLQWARSLGLEVLVKLSQRYIVDRPHWTELLLHELTVSGLSTIGRSCARWGWDLRTECVGMRVDRWHRPDVLAHLFPRRVEWAAEMVVFDDVRDRLEGRIHPWSLMSPARCEPIEGMLFREANPPADYQALADRLGVRLEEDFHCIDSTATAGYRPG